MSEQILFKREEDMPYVPVSFGLMDWNRTGSWRYLRPRFENKIPPCNEGCPAGQDVQGAMLLSGKGQFIEAWELLKEENPFPAVCGRVCFHPCESACNRGDFDDAVAINALERFLADAASRKGRRVRPPREKRPEKVAVVGSGPAGLSCAYHLARMGYGITVFEALPVLGGMLRVGIPEYRLPKKVLEEEIDQILDLGVKVETNVRLGEGLLLADLKEFPAVFLAMGNHRSKALGLPGEDAQGIMSGVEFLRRVNLGEEIAPGKRVAVIGGGNTALDAARTALRLGAKPFILYRRTREEMPAFAAEVLEAEEEGIEISYLVSPLRLVAEKGRITRLECVKNRLGPPDGDGRRRPVEMKGSNFFVEVDGVIAAVGEEADLAALPRKMILKEQAVAVDERGATKQKGMFAGGDLVPQPHTVVHAIGSGKRAAIFIDAFLRGEKGEGLLDALRIGERGGLSMRRYLAGANGLPLTSPTVRLKDLNLDYFEYKKGPKAPKAHLSRRTGGFEEVKLGLSEEAALDNARRCFSCGVCNLCDNCYILCPDVAILKAEGDGPNLVDYEHCKGCGICVQECPRNAMVMEEEGK